MQRKKTAVKRLQHSPLSANTRCLLVNKARGTSGIDDSNGVDVLLDSFVSVVQVQYDEVLSTEKCVGEWAVVSR